ncbi:MAG: glycosyltransferase [bacterium]|nr:glycosyltransferase [bacterium]
MKIAYISNSRFPSEKAQSDQVMAMCSAFAKLGHDVTLFVPDRILVVDEDPFRYYGKPKSFQLKRIPCIDLLRWPRLGRFAFWLQTYTFVRALKSHLALFQPDIIYSREPYVFAFGALNGLSVWESHTVHHSRWAKRFLNAIDAIVTLTNASKELFVKNGISPDRVFIEPDAVDPALFDEMPTSESARKQLQLPQEDVVLLYTGKFLTMNMPKGLDEAIEAVGILRKQGRRVRLIAVGGTKQDMEHYEKYMSNDGVTLLSHVAQSELKIFYAASDILLMPFPYTEHYAFFMSPLKLFEYLRIGKPIVVTDLPSVREIVSEEEAFFAIPGDVPSLVSTIETIIDHPEKSLECAKKAEILSKKYTWDFRASRIVEWLKNVPPSLGASLHQKQDQQGILGSSTQKSFIITAVLLLFLAGTRVLAYFLFSDYAARIGDPGFRILVGNWFQGYGYTFLHETGCVTAFRSPGFLFFITGIYFLFGFENYHALFLIQGAIVVLAGYLLYRLSTSISGDRRVGWLTLFLFTVCPYTFYHYTQYYHTFLSTFFIVTLVFALIRLDQTKRLAWAVLTGIAIACLAYVQGTILVATPFLALWLFIRWQPNWKKSIVAIFIMAGVSMAMIAPWAYRNWTVFHEFIPLTTDLGYGLYKSNNPYSYGLNALGYAQEVISGESIINPEDPLVEKYFFYPEVEDALRKNGYYVTSTYVADWHPRPPGSVSCTIQPQLSEKEFASYWVEKTFDWIRLHYWPDFVRLQAQKIIQFWSPGIHPAKKSLTQWPFGSQKSLADLALFAHFIFMTFVDLFAIFGVAVIVRAKQVGKYAPIFIILIVYTVMHSIFAGYTKYRIPLDNFVFLFASIAVIDQYKKFRIRYSERKEKVKKKDL